MTNTSPNKTYFAGMDCSFYNFHKDACVGSKFKCYRIEKYYNSIDVVEVTTSKVTEIVHVREDGCDIVRTASGSVYIVDVNRVFLQEYKLGYIERAPKPGKRLRVLPIFGMHGSPYVRDKGSYYHVTSVTQITEACYKIQCLEGALYVIQQS